MFIYLHLYIYIYIYMYIYIYTYISFVYLCATRGTNGFSNYDQGEGGASLQDLGEMHIRRTNEYD